MKTLYFDCTSGICGNMVLGALLEIVGDDNYLLDELKKIKADGYIINISKKDKNGILGKYVEVLVDGEDEYGHVHILEGEPQHHHEHRNLEDVNTIIDESKLDANTKDLAKRIFLRVAKAEAIVHGKDLTEVYFHEVGAIDSIVDIIGTAILINKINPDKIYSSIVNEGRGFIKCAHGVMSVPAPATTKIMQEGKVLFKQIDVDTELVTPTGAAIIAELAEEYNNMPAMRIEKIGLGAGTKDIENIPNLLRVVLGEEIENHKPIEENDFVVMETNIDDCSGEILGYTLEKLLKEGALDAFYTPIFMKKNRPAYRLTVTARAKDREKLQNIIFTETTTIGIRYRFENRSCLEREEVKVKTKYGMVKGKKVKVEDKVFVYPEFESIKKIAEEKNIPIKELYKLEELK